MKWQYLKERKLELKNIPYVCLTNDFWTNTADNSHLGIA